MFKTPVFVSLETRLSNISSPADIETQIRLATTQERKIMKLADSLRKKVRNPEYIAQYQTARRALSRASRVATDLKLGAQIIKDALEEGKAPYSIISKISQ